MSIDRFYTKTAFIQRSTDVSDGAGYSTTKWETIATVKGCLDMLSGSRTYMGHSEQTKYTHVFMCKPFSLLVTPKDRIVIGNTAFNIVFVDDPVMRHHHIEILLDFVSLINKNIIDTAEEELAFHTLFSDTTFSTDEGKD